MKTTLRAIKLFFILSILTGVLYPALVTVIGQALFPRQANGSLIEKNGKAIGSELIGQKFIDEKYFRPRPSAIDYNTLPSSGSNLGPTSETLRDSVIARQNRLQSENPGMGAFPRDLLFASGSGLDPDISPSAARFQANRVAFARGLDNDAQKKLFSLIESQIRQPDFGILGEPRISVLRLNMALDSVFADYHK
jgi:potassium-transporting ATPase KdpC subunit